MRHSFEAICGVILCIGAHSCAGKSNRDASLSIPVYPSLPDPDFSLDSGRLQLTANLFCAESRAGDPARDFLLGYLPLQTFDELCTEGLDRSRLGSRLADLHVSGYFGGVWLKDALSGAIPTASISESEESSSTDLGTGRPIGTLASERLRVVLDETDESVLSASREVVPALLAIHGYNLGYLQLLLHRPPAGAEPPPGILECAAFLDCRSSAVNLGMLERYRFILGELAASSATTWQEWRALVDSTASASASSGEKVWEGILSGASVPPDAYSPLLALSAGYLMVGETAALINMNAWATGSPSEARCGLVFSAGLEVWSASYFLGLASGASRGTFPRLHCS